MLKESVNSAHIVGKLNEIALTERDSAKDGRHYISGHVDILVDQVVSGSMEHSVIPVEVFCFEKTNKGADNPVYQNVHDLMTHGNSIAAVGFDKADIYEAYIRSGAIRENNFIGRDGTMVSTNRINGSFFTKRRQGETETEATFETEIVIAQIRDEVRGDAPTGRLLVDGLTVQYNGLPDRITYIVENKEAVDYISQNWQPEDTVMVNGKIRYAAQTQEIQSDIDVGFGEAPIRTRTRTVKEFVITSGTPPYDEDRKIDCEELDAALQQRKRATEDRLQNSRTSTAEPPLRPSSRFGSGRGF